VKIEATAGVVNIFRDYAEKFAAHPPAILDYFARADKGDSEEALFPFAPDSDRGLGILLLAASLHRPDASSSFGRESATIVAGLYRHFGTDVFKLNRVPFANLQAHIEVLASGLDAEDRARVPGILRSVCDFFYRVGPLVSWLADAPDWEQRVAELSHEIYWMGAHSRTRTKARLFFWLACAIPGFGTRSDMQTQAQRFVWPVGDGHMRFVFDILKPPRGAARGAPEVRLEAYADFARMVFPESPWQLYLPLESFLKPDGAGGYRCRSVQGGCRPCPLSSLCPAAKHFMGSELKNGGA
jgi:hypothetical protein